MQNFGLNCNYFSKAVDCGLIQQKTEGSFTKRPANRYALSNPIRPRQIGRPGAHRGADGGATLRVFAGGERRRRELAGDGCSGAPVGHLGCGLVQKDERDTRKTLEHAGWRFCAPAGLATARGGPGSPAWHGRAIPASV